MGTAEPPSLSRRNIELILVFVAGPGATRLISPIHTSALDIILCLCALSEKLCKTRRERHPLRVIDADFMLFQHVSSLGGRASRFNENST